MKPLGETACLAPVNCSCLTAFVGEEAYLLMHLQEPPRGDGASGSVNFLSFICPPSFLFVSWSSSQSARLFGGTFDQLFLRVLISYCACEMMLCKVNLCE